MVKIKTATEEVKPPAPSSTAGEKHGAAPLQDGLAASWEVKCTLTVWPSDPSSGCSPLRHENFRLHRNLHTECLQHLHSQQPNTADDPQVLQEVNGRTRCDSGYKINTNEYKKKQTLKNTATWMTLKDMLRGRSRMERSHAL